MDYELINVEQKGRVGVITLNRPKQLNALNDQVLKQRESMRAAADSRGPDTTTGSDGKGGPSHVIATTHTRPDAAIHAASLHNFLLKSRSLLGGTTPP